MRLLNIIVIIALVLAAAFVYEIKFQSTLQAERLAKLRIEARRERDAIATLRAEWATLDNPARIQGLAQRHLKLKPLVATQIDSLDHLPPRPPRIVPPSSADPIGAMIENAGEPEATGSITPTEQR
jgi:cell division protein FtsL